MEKGVARMEQVSRDDTRVLAAGHVWAAHTRGPRLVP